MVTSSLSATSGYTTPASSRNRKCISRKSGSMGEGVRAQS
jgi:hypothetical protein